MGLPAAALRVINLLDGERDMAQVIGDARISVDRTLAIIKKLTRDGMVAPIDHEILELAETLRDLPHPQQQCAAFTVEEEAFFHSEVEPYEEPPSSWTERVGLWWADLRIRLTGSPA